MKDRKAWLEKRRTLIGASDVPALLGYGFADQTPHTIWESKITPVPDEDETGVDRKQIGLLMEPVLRRIFERLTSLPTNLMHARLKRHKSLKFLGCTPDATCTHPEYGVAPVELKNVDVWNAAEWRVDDEIPMRVQIQLQIQMEVLDAEWGAAMALIGGNDPIVRWSQRNRDFFEALVPTLEDFWRCVETRTPPPPDSNQSTARVISRLYPRDNGTAIRLSDDVRLWAEVRERIKNEMRLCEATLTKAENHLKLALGDASYGEFADGSAISWKAQKRPELTVKETEYRVLRSHKGLPKGVEVSTKIEENKPKLLS